MSPDQGGYTADEDLRARIEAFSPDEPGIAFPFTARLAQENGWTREHARRVTREYLRFVYLAMTAGHPVTPSRAVDEAWHLHLTCTRSYWEEMCGRVLGRPLHHDPTRGGAEEEAKFADWYARTLHSYRAAFGEEPPADVWPRPIAASTSRAARRSAFQAATAPVASGHAAARRAWPTVLLGAAVCGVIAGVWMGGSLGVVVGFLMLVGVMLLAYVAPAFVSDALDANDPRARRRVVVGGGDAGWAGSCGGDGGGHADAGHHGGCGGHSGCGGHGGCGHGGCGSSGCGSSGCGGGH